MTFAVFRKELKVLWASPLPYVLAAVFHATFGVLAWGQIAGRGQAVFQPAVPIAGFLLLLVAPIVASRTFAEEIRTGTLELLLAIPVRGVALVAGKYLAVLVTLAALVAPIAVLAFLVSVYGDPDPGPIGSGFVGLLLLCAAVGAVSVFVSALTRSQPLAAVGSLFAVLVLWFAHTGSEALTVGGFFGALSISERLRSFAGGLIDLADLTFFLSITVVALAATLAAVESRRWR
ncbi:MAG TPA: ABC transporter permease [Actinomycetota bacterium]|jgi:ABC-2 type transport system permease protein|nr:ABC transporter permease [Actinomycetota bacterium]